jgi:hypothetical protein
MMSSARVALPICAIRFPGACDLIGDTEQRRERREEQPAADAGKQADPCPDGEQPGCPRYVPPDDQIDVNEGGSRTIRTIHKTK